MWLSQIITSRSTAPPPCQGMGGQNRSTPPTPKGDQGGPKSPRAVLGSLLLPSPIRGRKATQLLGEWAAKGVPGAAGSPTKAALTLPSAAPGCDASTKQLFCRVLLVLPMPCCSLSSPCWDHPSIHPSLEWQHPSGSSEGLCSAPSPCTQALLSVLGTASRAPAHSLHRCTHGLQKICPVLGNAKGEKK